jgi:hypothetical protein
VSPATYSSPLPLGVASELHVEPHPPAFYEYGREIAYLWAWAVP